jgi:hypothetical protein
MVLPRQKKILPHSEGDFAAAEGEASLLKEETKGDEVKLKLQLAASRQHPLSSFLEEVKLRGIKNFDTNQFVLDALSHIDAPWWQEQLDALTPLEFKISAALADPEMREKLKLLLASHI